MILKLSTARNLPVWMADSADHITGKASLTLTITASKDGAAFASISPTVTDLGSGWYNLALTTTHTNTQGALALHITATGADATDTQHEVCVDLPGGSVASVTGSVGSVTGAVGSVTGNVGGNVVGSVASVTGAVGSVTGNVGGNVTGSVGSVAGNVSGNVTGSVASVTGAVGSVTGNVGGNVTGSVGSIAANGITTASFANDAITDAKVAADVTIASVTGAVGSVTGSVGSVTGAVGSVTGAVGSVTGSVGGNVTGSVGSVVAPVTVGTNNDKTGYALSAASIDSVWDEVQSGHTTAGTFGKFLDAQVSLISGGGGGPSAAVIADAVWDEVLSGHLTAGTTGAALNTASAATAPSAVVIAQTLLDTSLGSGADTQTRSVRNALRFLRNRWGIASGTLTVSKEDDTTPAWTAAVVQTPGDPVSSVDPT